MIFIHLTQRTQLSSKAGHVLYATILQGNPRTKRVYASFTIANPRTQNSLLKGAQKYKIWTQF